MRHVGNTRVWGSVALGVAVLLPATVVGAADFSREDAAALERKVSTGTEQLRAAVQASADRSPSAKAALDLATEREAAMLSLIEVAPDLALQNVLPGALRDQLSPEVKAHVEEPVIIRGTLEVLGWVAEDGAAGYERYINRGQLRLQVFAKSFLDDSLSGDEVILSGLRLQDRMAVSERGSELIARADTGDEGTAGGVVDRSERGLLININFRDGPATQPWTIDTASNVFNNLIPARFTEGSYGHYNWDADVTPWLTIVASTATCNVNLWRDLGEAAARNLGYQPSQYQHVTVAFPRVTACGWAGLGQQPGRYTWLNNAMGPNTATHELGHNLGLFHSHSRRCSDGPLDGDCSAFSEYGDRFDTMGRGGSVLYHGAYRNFLHWLPDSQVVDVRATDGTATVAINSVETPEDARTLPLILRVERRGTNQTFFIEVREAIGLSADLAQYPYLQTGVPIYLGAGSTATRQHTIIDVGYTTTTTADAPLQVGDTLYDAIGNLSISPSYVGPGDDGRGIAVINVVYF